MRPEERWNKEAKDPSGKKKPSKKRKQTSEPVAGEMSNATVPGAISQRDGTGSPPQEAVDDGVVEQGSNEAVNDSLAARNAVRAVSLQPRGTGTAEQDKHRDDGTGVIMPQRETQSSPGRGLGTAGSPIDLDDWGSTRRLLFPSPNKSDQGAYRALKDITPSENQLLQEKEKNDNIPIKPTLTHCDSTTSNKENVTPAVSEQQEYDLSHLFEDDDEEVGIEAPKTPKTPPKTPPQHQRTPRSDRLLRSSTRSTRSALREKINGVMTSPSKSPLSSRCSRSSRGRRLGGVAGSSTGILRTPTTTATSGSRCQILLSKSKSPGRSVTKGGGSSPKQQQMTPFTAQMYHLLSETNFSSPAGRGGGGGIFTDSGNPNDNDNDNDTLMSNFEDYLPLLPGSISMSPRNHSSLFNLLDGIIGDDTAGDMLRGGRGGVGSGGGIGGAGAGRKGAVEGRDGRGLNTEELSTDIILPLPLPPPPPSSPPNMFSLYEDPREPKGGLWSDFDIPGDGDGDYGEVQHDDGTVEGCGEMEDLDKLKGYENGSGEGVAVGEIV